MQIAALLERKGHFVATISPDATINDAISELARQNVGALVVSMDERSIDGIISERDIVRALARVGAAILYDPVSTIMSGDVHTSSPDNDVESLMATMTDQRIRHIPVVKDNELVGIASIGDVVKTRIDELVQDRDALVNYIGAR